jgi:fatty acid desaturase
MHTHQFSDDILLDISRLSRKSNSLWTYYSIKFICSLLLVWCIAQYLWIIPLVFVLIAALQRGCVSLLHETTHNNLFSDKRLNKFFWKYIFAPISLSSFHSYRESHIGLHHKYLWDIEVDPDMKHYTIYHEDIIRGEFLYKLFTFQYHYIYLSYLLDMRFYLSLKKIEILSLIIWQIAIWTYLCWLYGIVWYFWLWIFPYLLVYPIIGILSELSEHYGLVGRWEKVSCFQTRNRNPKWWEKFFIGYYGDNYHLVHHLFSQIPCYALVDVDKILRRDHRYSHSSEVNSGGILTSCTWEPSFLSLII